VATAALLAPAFVAAVIYLPEPYFAVLLGTVVAMAAWEWSAFAELQTPGRRAGLVAAALAAGAIALVFARPAWPMLAAATIAWAGAAAWLWRRREGAGALRPPELRALAGVLALASAWFAIVWLRAQQPDGPYWVLALCLLVWCADIGAYFVGRKCGRRKLAPGISPGKTVEGLFGGIGAGMLGAAALALLPQIPLSGSWFLLCSFTLIISVFGDLLESLMKRSVGLKDSGALLPGHGGVLDRVDSLLAAAPVFALGYWLLAQR
jgi:phosphatidate cytidylyltransferase